MHTTQMPLLSTNCSIADKTYADELQKLNSNIETILNERLGEIKQGKSGNDSQKHSRVRVARGFLIF